MRIVFGMLTALVLTGASASPAASQLVKGSATAGPLAESITGQIMPCTNGRIKAFECQNVELLAYLPRTALGGAGVFDIWGWIDSTTNREFVLIAGEAGTAFVEVTDPVNPKYLGILPLHNGATSGIPGVKVYKHYAYIVSEIVMDHGMQVFDLKQLLDVKDGPVTFKETAHYANFGNAHTLILNPATGFAYAVGTFAGGETCGSGLHMIDIRTPDKPAFAGCYADTEQGAPLPGYIHDARCLTYNGPDQRYTGREICVYASGTAVGVVDVTDKAQPKRLGTVAYPHVGYTHQGWFTEDQRYFLLDDEGSNKGQATDKYPTMVFDMNRLDDIVVAAEFPGATTSTDHNLYIRGRYMYQSNYGSGLRIADVSDPKHPKEIGYLDTTPKEAEGAGLGAWGNFPFLKNDVVAVASDGLFLVRVKP